MKPTLWRCAILLSLSFSVLWSAEFNFTHPGALRTAADLENAWERAQSGKRPWAPAWEALQFQADEALKVQPNAPEVYSVPARYEDADGHARERARISSQTRAAYNLALASALLNRSNNQMDSSKGDAYARHAIAILMEWTRCEDMGENTQPFVRKETALVTCSTANGLLIAADLLYHHPAWGPADRNRFLNWVREVMVPASTIKTITYNNNWNTWGVYFSLLCAHLLEDEALFQEGVNLWKKDLTHHIKADGRMPKELARGKGKNWYTYYALAPITTAAVVIQNVSGENLMEPGSDTGVRVKAGLDYFFENLKGHNYRSLMEETGDIYRDRDYMDWNLGKRPVVGLDHHTGWVHPTLFLDWTDLPVNHPPVAKVEQTSVSTTVGNPVRLDAGPSFDSDGDSPLSYLWFLAGEDQVDMFDEPLMSSRDILYFPEPIQGQFAIEFTVTVREHGDMVAGLQPSTRRGFRWGASSFQLNVKNGRFQVRDGKGYRVVSELQYELDEPVRIRMEVDPAGKTYSVYGKPAGGAVVTLAENFKPRDGATDFTDIEKLIYTGREGAEITDVRLVRTGRTLNGETTDVTINTPGMHPVRLTVTDPYGATDETELTVEVTP